MIKKLIQAYHWIYNKSELRVIEKIMGDENYFRQEITFFDDGRVAAAVENIKRDHARLEQDIAMIEKQQSITSEDKQKLDYLYGRKLELIKLMAFQVSQNAKNITGARRLLEGLDVDFAECLAALDTYMSGDKAEGLALLTQYLDSGKDWDKHYLLNKVYGTEMFAAGRLEQAYRYLYRTVQVCPEDAAAHRMLGELYRTSGKERAAAVERDVLELLGAGA